MYYNDCHTHWSQYLQLNAVNRKQSLANASFERAKFCFIVSAHITMAIKFSREIQAVVLTGFLSSLSRDESLVWRDEILVSRDKILVPRKGGNLLLSGAVCSYLQHLLIQYIWVIDQACLVKMVGLVAKFFYVCLWTKTESRSITPQKKNEANIQPS